MGEQTDKSLDFLVTSKKEDIKITSDHEAYAFLLEYITDCNGNILACQNRLNEFWEHVKSQDKLPEKMYALRELCQDSYILLDSVAKLCAVVEQGIESMCERDDD